MENRFMEHKLGGNIEVKRVWLLKGNMRTPCIWKYSIFYLYEHKYPGHDGIL